MEVPNNVGDVIDLYYGTIEATRPPKTARQIIRETDSALARFISEKIGFRCANPGRRMTKMEQKAALALVRQCSLKLLRKFIVFAEKSFEEQSISTAVRNTYGLRIRHLLGFAEGESWYPGNRKTQRFQDECAPPLPRRFGETTKDLVMPQRKANIVYSLKPEESNSILEEQLTQLFEFICAPQHPDRHVRICKPSVALQYVAQVREFLGWWKRYYDPNIASERLSLDLLVPLITEDELDKLTLRVRKHKWREMSRQLRSWVYAYFDFVRTQLGSYSPHTRSGELSALRKVAQFQYAQEIESAAEYRQIPLMGVIEELQKQYREDISVWRSQRRYAADKSKQWPEVPPNETALNVLRTDLLTKLRLRCRPRSSNGTFHEPRAQATAYVKFLIWYELLFEPSRRQQEFRSRRIALACPLERPASVPVDGLYHPLPPDEVRERGLDGSFADNYFYKTYELKGMHYPEGVWVRQVTTYKTDKSYGTQDIIVRNRNFGDGHCLYDYIERYLYGHWYTGHFQDSFLYDWWDAELQHRHGRWLSPGISHFPFICHPASHDIAGDWPWTLFWPVPSTGEEYVDSQMAAMVATAAHEWIGKRIPPHVLRRIWATWAFQVELDDRLIRSLAYAMGTSYETLRRWYEQSTPEDKRRPIEEHLDELFLDYLEQLETDDAADSNSIAFKKVVNLLPKLSLEEQQSVRDILADAS